MNNAKKPMNSLFLNYLLSSQSKVDTNAEKWLESKNILDNINTICFMLPCKALVQST